MSSPDLAEILDKINDGICVLSRDQKVSFVKEKAAEILNAADQTFFKKIAEAVEERSTLRFEHFHAPLNRWFEHHTFPNADGGLTVTSRDRTSQHRIEDDLRTSEERLQRLIESNTNGVIVVETGINTQANDVLLSIAHYTREHLVQKPLGWHEMTPSESDVL